MAGESAWTGITTIGTVEANSHVYVMQEDIDAAAGSWVEEKVVAAKGASDWWGDGQIDILVKTKEADSVIGANPEDGTKGVATFMIRQYSKTYTHFIATALETTGGNTVVPFSSADDLNNETGYRTLTMSGDSGNFTVGDRVSNDASTPVAVITAISGASPTRTLEYYLIGDPLVDFVDTETVTNLDDTGTGTVNGNPNDTGPALDTTITVAFGATTEDINNGNGARPYSTRINPAGLAVSRVYERLKYVTRRGSVVALQGQDGEEYLGAELQIEYSGQATNLNEGEEIVGDASGARGVVMAVHDDGSTGDVILKAVRGTFAVSETFTGSTSGGDGLITALRTITPSATAPLGTFAGGTFFGAAGVTLTTANLAGGDVQAYQQVDDDGNTQVPPNAQSVAVTNLVSGDTVAVFRRSGSAVVKTQFQLAAGNNEGDATVEVDATIPSDNPTNSHSKIRVVSPSGEEHRYRYASYSGTTFTLETASVGTATAGSDDTTLIDSGATFQADGVEVGDYVRNTTDGVFVRVVSVDSEVQVTTEAGGAWGTGDGYSVNTLVENYGVGQDAYVPFIERVADAASEANQFIYGGDVDVRVVVRRTTAIAILPFAQDSAIGSGGLSVAAIRSPDTIIT